MAYEARGSRLYYYRPVRRGKKVVREYYGRGDCAKLAAEMQATRTHRRNAVRQQETAFLDQLHAIDGRVDQLGVVVQAIAAATLYGRGFYRHGREWRVRKRCPKQSRILEPANPSGRTLQDLIQLVVRANAYDEDARRQLCGYLVANPEIWSAHAQLALEVRLELLRLVATDDPAKRDELSQQCHAVRLQLGGGNPSTVELAVVDYISLRWLQFQHSESLCQQLSAASSRLRKSIARRRARIRGRHESALKIFAKVRSLCPC